MSTEPSSGPAPDRVDVTIEEVDCATVDAFTEVLRSAVQRPGQRLVVDFATVRFLDSSGMRALVVVDRELRSEGGELVLAEVQTGVRRALEAGGLLEHFSVE